jgi:hypothetical protein
MSTADEHCNTTKNKDGKIVCDPPSCGKFWSFDDHNNKQENRANCKVVRDLDVTIDKGKVTNNGPFPDRAPYCLCIIDDFRVELDNKNRMTSPTDKQLKQKYYETETDAAKGTNPITTTQKWIQYGEDEKSGQLYIVVTH